MLTMPPDAAPPEYPFLKMTWDSPIRISVNGKEVSKKLGTMAEPGGVFLPKPVAATLKPGANTVRVQTLVELAEAPQLAVGLIDWRVEKH